MTGFRSVLCLAGWLALSACSPEQSVRPSETAEKPASTATSKAPLANKTLPGSKVPTTTGAYLVTLRPQSGEYLIGIPQPWVATISNSEGNAFVPNALYFDGGMPGHGHGLPSAPRFTRHLGGTEFLLEGMTLNMPGDWQFVVTVGGPAGIDSATFNLNIQPESPASPVNSKATTDWSGEQLALIDSLRLDWLPPVRDESNRLLGNAEAIALGKELFTDPGLSASGKVSCASCHIKTLAFADGKPLGFGTQTTARHTPTLLGVAHANWFYWDGRRDSLWAQAITPIETIGEMDNNRTDAVRFVSSHPNYGERFKRFAANPAEPVDFSDLTSFPAGASPFGAGKFRWHRMTAENQARVNRAYATIGKVLASFEATLAHQPSRFDRWAGNAVGKTTRELSLDGPAQLSGEEQAGLRLFLDLPRTQCLRCHNGPLFSNQGFHNIATSEPAPGASGTHDFGRMLGLQSVIVDPFNCSGEYSDAPDTGCNHLRFARRQNLGETIDGAFKVPSLRNLSASAPYFHDGRFTSLEAVVDHYRNQGGGGVVRQSEVPDIELTDSERDQLVAFLQVL